MKKIVWSVLSISLIAVCSAAPLAIPPDVGTALRAAYTPQKLAAVRSLKLMYGVSGSGLPGAILVVRANKDQVRLDSVSADGIYTACRNREEFWGFDGKNGSVMLTKEDIQAMKYDVCFLPLPFVWKEIYAPLTFQGPLNADVNNFTTVSADGKSVKLNVHVQKKSGLLDRVEMEGRAGISVISFREYQDFDGAQLATRILCSSPEGTITLRLRSVDWNPEFPEKSFARHDSSTDGDLQLLQKGLAALPVKKAAPPPKKVLTPEELEKQKQRSAEKAAALRKQRIIRCHKMLRDLDMQIEEKEKIREKCEAYYETNKRDALNAAERSSEKQYVYRYTWSYRSWGHVRPRRVSSGNSTQRKIANALFNEADDAVRQYQKISKELVSLRLKRSEVLAELEKLEAK